MQVALEKFKGTFPAVVTPFTQDGTQLDLESLRALLKFQLDAGVDGFVVCGSTGESQTLSSEEYQQVVSETVKFVAKRVPVIAGIGVSSTLRAMEIAKYLDSSEVSGILLVAPPYNKPPQRGIFRHFEQVRNATSLPIIAYNIPGRTAVNILPATLADLWKAKIIVGVKESSASLDQALDIMALVDDSFLLISGEDSLVHALMASGGCGVISATANVVPDAFVNITQPALRGDWHSALTSQMNVLPVVRAMFIETNPIPVKCALALKGIIRFPTVRLPLTEATSETVAALRRVLKL